MGQFDAHTRMLGLLRVWEFVVGMSGCAVVLFGAYLTLSGGHPFGAMFTLLVGATGMCVVVISILRNYDGRYAEFKRRHDQRRS